MDKLWSPFNFNKCLLSIYVRPWYSSWFHIGLLIHKMFWKAYRTHAFLVPNCEVSPNKPVVGGMCDDTSAQIAFSMDMNVKTQHLLSLTCSTSGYLYIACMLCILYPQCYVVIRVNNHAPVLQELTLCQGHGGTIRSSWYLCWVRVTSRMFGVRSGTSPDWEYREASGILKSKIESGQES